MKFPKPFVWSLLAGLFVSSPANALEEPTYSVVAAVNDIEYRQYQPYLVAETIVSGTVDRDEASTIGFRRLFDYISGANADQTEIAMTAPVQQQPRGVTIDMTTPVRQTSVDRDWLISFVVPDQFSETNVPQPNNPTVYIRSVPGELVAVLRYSGRWSDENISTHKGRLLDTLADEGISPEGEVVVAFYNAPFTLPFMRRNEVMVIASRSPTVDVQSVTP